MFETIRNWFTTFEPKEVKVPGLGRLHNDRYGNWLGKKTIQPIAQELELLFRTGSEPPGEKAAQFVREVEDQFPRLWEEVGKQVFADLPTWEDGTTMPELFQSLCITDFCFWNLS